MKTKYSTYKKRVVYSIILLLLIHIISQNMPSSTTSVDRNAVKNYKSNNKSPIESRTAEQSVSEESSDEANKTVLAKEKSPDIREAKYIRNPTSDYVAKVPTVADYVNSTWKPDEYSKANTAKIVESDKFIEPYRTISVDATDGKYGDQMRANVVTKSCDIPPVPPPYHIAAAFSKKAALFQQFNNRMFSSLLRTILLIN